MKWIVGAALTLGIPCAWAQEAAPMPETDSGSMPGMAPQTGGGMGSMKPGSRGMSSTSMQGGSAPSNARDPNAYSDGYGFGPIPPPRMADERNFRSLLVDRFEGVRVRDDSFLAYDLQGWYGRTYDRAVLKAEGQVDNGGLQALRAREGAKRRGE